MADLSNNSFIPKRGPVKHNRGAASRQVYVFTFISYILMFATLLAAGSVYLYGKYIDKQLESEIAALNAEIGSFSETDMQKVLEFDLRLSQASNRLNKSVSIVSVFDALEAATIDTVQINSLNLKREKDDKFVLSASIETDSFDSTIFQRGVYQRNKIIESVVISDVQATNKTEGSGDNAGPAKSGISFTAELEIPLSSVPYVENAIQTQPIIITQPATDQIINDEEDSAVKALEGNEENI